MKKKARKKTKNKTELKAMIITHPIHTGFKPSR